MAETRRLCPACSKPAAYVVARIVYPRSEDIWPKAALVCWSCKRVRMRGEPWSGIDWSRHEREWKTERKKEQRL